MYILSPTDRLFRSIRTHQCGYIYIVFKQMVTKSYNRTKQYGCLTRRSSSQWSSFTPGISCCTTPDQSSLLGQQDNSVPEESFDLSDEDISQQCKFALCKEVNVFR